MLRKGTQSADVAKWQKFLGLPSDGIFGNDTEKATIKWKIANGLNQTGIVDDATWAKAGLLTVKSASVAVSSYFPPRPNFSSPSKDTRAKLFGTFAWTKVNSSDIRITDGWAGKNIVKVYIPQLIGVNGFPKDGMVQFHKAGAKQLQGFFAEVERQGLLHLVISWAGSFYPRFIRGSSKSLSNHSWGTAFDINAPENWLNAKPASIGQKGSLLKLVPIANSFGFYWGGHFTRQDGMHFELAVLDMFPAPTSAINETPVKIVSVSQDSAVSQTPQASGKVEAEVSAPVENQVENPPIVPIEEPPNNEGEMGIPGKANDFPAFLPQIDTAKTWAKTGISGLFTGTIGSAFAGLPQWVTISLAVILAIAIIGVIVMFVKYHKEIFSYVTKMNAIKADPTQGNPTLTSNEEKVR
jgi:hypothetical protein